LSKKKEQMDLMKSELEEKVTSSATQPPPAAGPDSRLELARKLIVLQKQQTALLEEKDGLITGRNSEFEKRVALLEKRIKDLVNSNQANTTAGQGRMQELQSELSQKTLQVALLKNELKNKLAEERAEREITDRLKEQLKSINNQSDLMRDYQSKLESKNSAYNEQMLQLQISRKELLEKQKQIAYLNGRLRAEEAKVVQLKSELYELHKSADGRDTDLQAKDLDLVMVEQKSRGKIAQYLANINQLKAANVRQAMELTGLRQQLEEAREQLKSVPKSSAPATSGAAADAEEYRKEFKKQSREFKSLQEQLRDARATIKQKDEDLKYKKMEIIRLKERFAATERDLKNQIKDLTSRLKSSPRKAMDQTPAVKVEKVVVYKEVNKAANKAAQEENMVETLQARLKSDDIEIKELREELKQVKSAARNDVDTEKSPLAEKLQQALDKITADGEKIQALSQNCSGTVNLGK